MNSPLSCAGRVLLFACAAALAGCNTAPGESDISPFVKDVFACNQMTVDQVKKTDGIPGKDGHYGIEYSFHVSFKGGAEGTQKLMEEFASTFKSRNVKNDPFEGCNFAVLKDWYDYTDVKRLSDPQYPAPIGVNVVGTAQMLKSEGGWRLLGDLNIQNAEFVEAPDSARAYVVVPKPVVAPDMPPANAVMPPPSGLASPAATPDDH